MLLYYYRSDEFFNDLPKPHIKTAEKRKSKPETPTIASKRERRESNEILPGITVICEKNLSVLIIFSYFYVYQILLIRLVLILLNF